MSFGRNPHVAKAEAAEQKAKTARDAGACVMAWRDAARQWDRAADRETDDKRRAIYQEKAELARARAEGSPINVEDPSELSALDPEARPRPKPKPGSSLN